MLTHSEMTNNSQEGALPMPTLEKTDGRLPRSALRYRPTAADTITVDEYVTGVNIPALQVHRASRLRQPQAVDDAAEQDDSDAAQTGRESATATRVRRAPAMPKTLPHTPRPQQTTRPRARLHPLFFLGVGMLATLALIAVLSIVTSWFTTTLNDLRYGRPRTFQIDAYVGHNEAAGMPSHFLAVNLHGRIEIIELPGGDASHARIYIGPQLYGADADLIPVTLSFIDVNGDHQPDMIINFQGTQVVFINDQGEFRPLRPEEREGVERFLQQLLPSR
jgi:hypothetical protein